MAEICCEDYNKNNPVESTTSYHRAARRRRMEIRQFKIIAGGGVSTNDGKENAGDELTKRQRKDMEIEMDTTAATAAATSFSAECNKNNAVGENGVVSNERVRNMISNSEEDDDNRNNNSSSSSKEELSYQSRIVSAKSLGLSSSSSVVRIENSNDVVPRFGIASVCGRRRDMEDAVAVHPSFFRQENSGASESHYFAVYDGHGCSHVAKKCRERLHELVKEELLVGVPLPVAEWKMALERSFKRMDKEAVAWNEGAIGNCRCELQTPECDAVGSTAVVAIVTPEKIIVANCGDSRAVLCRNGKPFPLSIDHKPDRPDELNRIQEAGGRVIYWDGPRVLGVLAMSRAIGDNYLKPYVSSEPEVTITDRTTDDECLILASDGLWDVVTNDTACGVARMCLRGKVPPTTVTPEVEAISNDGERMADKACSDASMLLTKLALARHSTDNVSVVVIDLRKDKHV